MALATRRWLTMRFFTFTGALLKAASVAARSPISHLNATLPGAPSWSLGAPHERRVRQPRELQVVDVLAASRDEARVLAPLDRFTEEPVGGDGGHQALLTSSRACARPPTRSPSRCCDSRCSGRDYLRA